MPIGKDSIKKRVAKVAETEAPAKEEKPAKAPAKKAASTAKKPAAVKPAAKKAAPKAEAPVVEPATAVMGNVAPETVERVVGHAENAAVEHVQIGHKMPTHLL